MFGQQSTVGGNKQVCSFYLKGSCKFGTQCWNLHPQNQGVGAMGSPFSMNNTVFGAKTNTQTDSKEFMEFVKQVSGEMTQWERSGQWLFSSFTPLKSHPMLAGFSDVSPEEMRMQAYDALKTKTFSAYQDHWSKLQQQYKQLRDALRQPSPDAYQAMREVFHAKGNLDQQQNPSSSQAIKSTGLFGKQTLFGSNVTQAQPGVGLLGAKPQSSFGGGSLFGGNQPSTTSMFGDTSKTSVFGGTAGLATQNANTFGAQPNVSPFSNTGNNLFKNNTPTSSSVFGAPPKIGSNSLFGGSTATSNSGNIFGSPSIFGNSSNAVAPAAGSIFGGVNSSNAAAPATGSIFGGASSVNTISTPNVFGGASTATSSTANVFGGGVSTNNTTPSTGVIFGSVSSSSTATSATPSIFGSGQNQASSVFGASNQTQQPPFGAGKVFSGTTSTSLFGTTSDNGASSLFGNKPSIFGGQQNQPQQQTTSLFSNNPASTASIFGGTPSTTSTPSQNTASSLFTSSSLGMPSSNIFGGSSSTPNQTGGNGLFGNAPAMGQTSTGLFGNTGQSSGNIGLFGKPQESSQSLQISTASQQAPLLFSGGNKVNPNVKAEWYTPLDQLSQADKAQFEADDFTFIPLCPPPLELSF